MIYHTKIINLPDRSDRQALVMGGMTVYLTGPTAWHWSCCTVFNIRRWASWHQLRPVITVDIVIIVVVILFVKINVSYINLIC
jgi:hypothetical protein